MRADILPGCMSMSQVCAVLVEIKREHQKGRRGSFGSVSGEKGQGIGRSSVERQRVLGKDKQLQKKKSRGRREEWLGKPG